MLGLIFSIAITLVYVVVIIYLVKKNNKEVAEQTVVDQIFKQASLEHNTTITEKEEVYEGINGGKFILKTSEKTGKLYKVYLKKEDYGNTI